MLFFHFYIKHPWPQVMNWREAVIVSIKITLWHGYNAFGPIVALVFLSDCAVCCTVKLKKKRKLSICPKFHNYCTVELYYQYQCQTELTKYKPLNNFENYSFSTYTLCRKQWRSKMFASHCCLKLLLDYGVRRARMLLCGERKYLRINM